MNDPQIFEKPKKFEKVSKWSNSKSYHVKSEIWRPSTSPSVSHPRLSYFSAENLRNVEIFNFSLVMVVRSLENLENLEKSGKNKMVRENLENLEKSGNFFLSDPKIFFLSICGSAISNLPFEYVKILHSGPFQNLKFQNFLQPW